MKSIPDIIREAELLDPDEFWEPAGERLWACVAFGETISGFQGRPRQVALMNKVCDASDDHRRFMDIALAPPLAHSQRKP